MSWQHFSALDPELLRGECFGAYQIISEIGRGGMGVVFLAERVDGHYQSQVAIKVSRYGLDSDATVDRFDAERQFLAHLSHPNIARLLDGGTSDCGHPYLVMEYIQGADTDSYCTDRELTITEVLSLMNQVCDAVHYAHQNLIVHCDLKPANIMVTAEGVPKLIDFGVATSLKPTLLDPAVLPGKVAFEEPGRQRMPLTPEFAAPEQLYGASVTTTADVYSLGVVLYKLLTGRLPCHVDGVPQQEAAHAVTNTDAAPPSRVAPPSDQKELQGDLDRLVMKAMHKDPSQRYSSAQMLADDIARYLADQPISATKLKFLPLL